MSSKRQFRIYVNGDAKPKAQVRGEIALEKALAQVGKTNPNAMLVVKEVTESIIQISLTTDTGDISLTI